MDHKLVISITPQILDFNYNNKIKVDSRSHLIPKHPTYDAEKYKYNINMLVQRMKCEFLKIHLTLITLAFYGCSTSNVNDNTLPESEAHNNAAPYIDNQPKKGIFEKPYFFPLLIKDINNDIIDVTITKLPSWLNFDSNTKQFYGTPIKNGITDDNVVLLELNDGTTVAEYEFKLILIEPITVQLTWDEPNDKDVSHYHIYTGKNPNLFTKLIARVENSTTSYTIEPTSGDNYYTITSVDFAGNESTYSETVDYYSL